MITWLALIAGTLVFGACIVGAMVLSRPYSALMVLLGIGGLVASLYTLGTIAQIYSTPVAIGSAILFVVVGIVGGYAVAATGVPHLASLRPRRPNTPQSGAAQTGIVLLGCAEPPRYDPRAVAHQQNLLAETASIELPLSAVPFVFLTEKTRYRAVGGVAPGAAIATALADKVSGLWPASYRPAVTTASCQYPGDLQDAVAAQARAGVRRVAIVVLGPLESAAGEHALAAATCGLDREVGPGVCVAPPIWNDRSMVRRLADRILACAGDTPPESIGVALVCPGSPETWERRYAAAEETENYFIQRVRMLLVEAGFADPHVKVARLEWQSPDVTETVRHLAVLGCQRIIVVPATTVLPTLETLLDLERAVSYARVPGTVTTITLGAWGDDDVLVAAVGAAATAALEDR